MMNRAEYHKALKDIPKNWGTRKRLTRYVEITSEYVGALERALAPMAECVTKDVERDGITLDEANVAYDVLSTGEKSPLTPAEISEAHLQEDQDDSKNRPQQPLPR